MVQITLMSLRCARNRSSSAHSHAKSISSMEMDPLWSTSSRWNTSPRSKRSARDICVGCRCQGQMVRRNTRVTHCPCMHHVPLGHGIVLDPIVHHTVPRESFAICCKSLKMQSGVVNMRVMLEHRKFHCSTGYPRSASRILAGFCV